MLTLNNKLEQDLVLNIVVIAAHNIIAAIALVIVILVIAIVISVVAVLAKVVQLVLVVAVGAAKHLVEADIAMTVLV